MIYDRYFNRTCDKLAAAIGIYSGLAYKKIGELENCEALHTKEHYRNLPEGEYAKIEKGDRWGGEWMNLWLRGTARFTEDVPGKVYLIPHTNALEILCFVNGRPAGLINSKGENIVSGLHAAAYLAENITAGTCFEVALENYAGHHIPGTAPYDNYGQDAPKDGSFDKVYAGVDIAVLDEDVFGFIFDLNALVQLAKAPDQNREINVTARNKAEEIFKVLVQSPLDCEEAVWRASLLKCREIMADLFVCEEQNTANGYVGIIGHSHMDTAWLWPVQETIRKCARTYANALSLMDRYPEYTFIQSSALHLDWMRRYYPAIFEGIVKRTAEGRYEPNGGVWVECDCNITSGELMARQFLYGQRFTRKYLNYTSDSFWLPDTFGYNAAIPQIMRESEIKYFYTTKMSWGDLNEFPRDTFIWRGIDGSEVMTHLNIMHTHPDVKNTYRAVSLIKDPAVFNGKLLAFGFGDGGGGPTAGMIEDARRVSKLPGVPKVEYTTVSNFLKKAENEAVNPDVYDSELYLELHRGTLTQMHDIKRNNRLCEIALHTMEYMNVLADDADREKIDELYKVLLINQFHDILPGTSITAVNELTRSEVKDTIAEANALTAQAADKITEKEDGCITVFNPAPFEINSFKAELDGGVSGALSQKYTDVTGRDITAVYGTSVPAYGAASFAVSEKAAEEASAFVYSENRLETPFYKVVFDADGAIVSLYDKENDREVVSCTPLNTFYVGEDVPQSWDNWDIDNDLQDKMVKDMRLVSREVVSDGALLFALRSEYRIAYRSSLKQDMIFYAKERRIDFHTVIDWNDKHQLLKVGFDVDILANTMKNEIQFGHVERPTTRNTSHESAKFEVVNHKWTDVSESRYGVAVLNDCKYGISGLKNNAGGVDVRLTLKKSGVRPDTTGDRGVNEMTYSLLPHSGAFTVPSVAAEAYRFNIPAVAVQGKADVTPIVSVNADNIVIETVKPAEDNSRNYVVRLYEAERSKTGCVLKLGNAKKAYLTNMLEDVKEELTLNNGEVKLSFRPFEIKTILVERD